MKLQSLINGLIFVSTAIAIALESAVIKVNDEAIHFGEISTQEIKQLALESTKDKLDFEVYLKDLDTVPHQVMVTLGNGAGLDAPFFPKFNLAKKAVKLSISASKIPVSIRNLDKIFINLVVANSGEKSNLFKPLGEFVPSDEFKGLVPYKKSERVGLQPEIHHIFGGEPKTVNPFIPILFGGFDIIVFFGLLGVWVAQIGGDMYGLVKSTPASQIAGNVTFLLCLVGYEIVFIRYYLGTSIFTTLFHSLLLATPTVFYGAGAFRHLAYLRKIGKA